MYDPRDGQVRYLVHFDDGGSGMRNRDRPLEPGDELADDGGPLPRHPCGVTAQPKRVRPRMGRAHH
jgi:hypothetical protein